MSEQSNAQSNADAARDAGNVVSEQSDAARNAGVIAGVTAPAKPAASKPAGKRTAGKPAGSTKPAARNVSKMTRAQLESALADALKSAPAAPAAPAKPAERNATARKDSIMSYMIVTCADAIDSDASFKRAQSNARKAGIDLSDVTREEMRDALAQRLSYAPGDYWDARLGAPRKLQAGKRSKTYAASQRTPAQRRVSKPAGSKPAKPAASKRKSNAA